MYNQGVLLLVRVVTKNAKNLPANFAVFAHTCPISASANLVELTIILSDLDFIMELFCDFKAHQ